MNNSPEVDKYIQCFPEDVAVKLKLIRKMIKEEAPDSGERISYGVPTATINDKYFIYFAGYKNHISIYPVTPAMEEHVKEALEYRTGKGTFQFPLDKDLPLELIRKIIKARYKEMKG